MYELKVERLEYVHRKRWPLKISPILAGSDVDEDEDKMRQPFGIWLLSGGGR